jgi:hypothetical protein
MKIIEELKKLSDEQIASAENARKICEQEALIWDFKKCKEKGCVYTYRQKFYCGTYGCVHSMSEWTQNNIPFDDKYEQKKNIKNEVEK